MEVRKRPGSPYWLVDLVDPRGARVRRSTGERDKRRAQQRAAEIQAGILEAAKGDRDGLRAVTLRQALADYLEKCKAERLASLRNVAALCAKLIGPDRWHMDGDRPLHEITGADLERLKVARAGEGNGVQTIAHELKTLRAASRYAETLGHRGPAVRAWKVPVAPAKTRYLSWPEFERVYAQMDPERPIQAARKGRIMESYRLVGPAREALMDARDMLVALAFMGGRWGEIAALSWDQVEDHTVRLWGSKVGKERTVPLPPQVADMLARRRAARPVGQFLVFPGRCGGLRVGSSRSIQRAIDAAGLNRPDLVARYGRATIHSLRHSYASWLRQNGAGLDEVQQMLGHASLQMTRRYAALGQTATLDRVRNILAGMS